VGVSSVVGGIFRRRSLPRGLLIRCAAPLAASTPRPAGAALPRIGRRDIVVVDQLYERQLGAVAGPLADADDARVPAGTIADLLRDVTKEFFDGILVLEMAEYLPPVVLGVFRWRA